jgi:glycosyltransferase involved in cell wall biosynthesis
LQTLISIVIPALNEQDNIGPLERELAQSLDGLPYDFEFIVVDNGSTDGTEAAVRAICARDRRWKYVRFSRNFGVEASITAGYRLASGDAIVVVYSDLLWCSDGPAG